MTTDKILTSEELVEEWTAAQPEFNQAAFRNAALSIVRMAKSEARTEMLMQERNQLTERSLH